LSASAELLVFTGRMPFMAPNQQCQSIPWTCLPQSHLGVFQLCLCLGPQNPISTVSESVRAAQRIDVQASHHAPCCILNTRQWWERQVVTQLPLYRLIIWASPDDQSVGAVGGALPWAFGLASHQFLCASLPVT